MSRKSRIITSVIIFTCLLSVLVMLLLPLFEFWSLYHFFCNTATNNYLYFRLYDSNGCLSVHTKLVLSNMNEAANSQLTESDLLKVSRCFRLQYLEMHDYYLSRSFFNSLSLSQTLKDVTLNDCDFDTSHLYFLKKNSRLNSVSICCKYQNNKAISNIIFELRDVKSIKYIYLKNAMLSSRDVEFFATPQNLETLCLVDCYFSSTDVKSAFFNHMRDHTTIKTLVIDAPKDGFSLEDLRSILESDKLSVVALTSDDINDDSIHRITDCVSSIKQLTIGSNSISDSSLSGCVSIARDRILRLTSTSITEEGIKMFISDDQSVSYKFLDGYDNEIILQPVVVQGVSSELKTPDSEPDSGKIDLKKELENKEPVASQPEK